uniref:Origin recognition complex subunit 2 n=1 Tax=Latimeria chalumnae TaxID=7897 RepID=H3B313_LATCH
TMIPQKRDKALEVRFVGDEDVLDHILDKQGCTKLRKKAVQTLVNVKKSRKKQEPESDEEDQEVYNEKDYVEALGTEIQGTKKTGSGGGGDVYTFQNTKPLKKMAQLASELARTPGKSVKFSHCNSPGEGTSLSKANSKSPARNKTPSKGKKNVFVSTTPYRLRKRLTAPSLRSDSDSDYSPSNSEEEEDEEGEKSVKQTPKQKLLGKHVAVGSEKTPANKSKRVPESNSVEEYFEAHSSSKVLTSDRTLQKLQKPKLNQETLSKLLSEASSMFAEELKQLNEEYEQLFHKWMLQLHLGFNIVLHGLGSKKSLLEKFRSTLLQDFCHIVVNGFFPSITIKSILNSVTEEVLGHAGSFRNPLDQLGFISESFKKDPSLQLYLIIHNIDGQMLRGERTQQLLGQLAAVPNIHLLASLDHINAPLMWDQSKLSLFNWLWYETTTYKAYVEETSYENSFLVQQSGALALSSLTHVLRSLTPNARGIFRLLAHFHLENKDNPSYIGLSFQDFYQRCREAFLVNSDLTLRAQLTEFKDHKLIRTKKGADGAKYLVIAVEMGTLTDFLEMEDKEI